MHWKLYFAALISLSRAVESLDLPPWIKIVDDSTMVNSFVEEEEDDFGVHEFDFDLFNETEWKASGPTQDTISFDLDFMVCSIDREIRRNRKDGYFLFATESGAARAQ
jgi:hypothetical protein